MNENKTSLKLSFVQFGKSFAAVLAHRDLESALSAATLQQRPLTNSALYRRTLDNAMFSDIPPLTPCQYDQSLDPNLRSSVITSVCFPSYRGGLYSCVWRNTHRDGKGLACALLLYLVEKCDLCWPLRVPGNHSNAGRSTQKGRRM